MAYIGMRCPVAAKIYSHTPGQEPVYDPGMIVGKAISGNLTITRNNNPLYGDDAIAEDDNGITAMSIEVGLDDLLENAQGYLLNTHKDGSSYYDQDKNAPEVGFGYIRVRRKNGVTTYQATWIYKAEFGFDSETGETKGESINWQTPTVTGRAFGISIDDTARNTYRARANFDTEAEAKAWLMEKAAFSNANLLKGTNGSKCTDPLSMNKRPTSGPKFSFTDIGQEMTTGDTTNSYTLSFKYRTIGIGGSEVPNNVSGSFAVYLVHPNGSNKIGDSVTLDGPVSDWATFEETITLTANQAAAGKTRSIDFSGISLAPTTGWQLEIKEMQFVQGSTAGTWAPAPEERYDT